MNITNMKSKRPLIWLSVALYAAAAIGINAFASSEKKAPAKGDFVKGAAIWADACVRCHNMRDPQELNDDQWKSVVSHMRLRAGLTGQDARDVLAFLQQSNNK